jgi:hypothetical protein
LRQQWVERLVRRLSMRRLHLVEQLVLLLTPLMLALLLLRVLLLRVLLLLRHERRA